MDNERKRKARDEGPRGDDNYRPERQRRGDDRGGNNRRDGNRGDSNRGDSNRRDNTRGNNTGADNYRPPASRGNGNRGDSSKGDNWRPDAPRGNGNRGESNRGNSRRGGDNKRPRYHDWDAPGQGAPPPRDAPRRDAPPRSAPPRDAPKRDAPPRDAPKRDAPVRDAPVRDAPVRAAPVKAAPVKAAPVKDAPARDVPMSDAPAPHAPAQDAPKRDAPARDVPMKDAPARTNNRDQRRKVSQEKPKPKPVQSVIVPVVKAAPKPKFIQAGDSGVWVTCPRGKERACAAEVVQMFTDYAKAMYPEATSNDEHETKDTDDIAAQINSEVSEMKKGTKTPLFETIVFETSCLVFCRTRAPIEPVALVKKICEDAVANPHHRLARHVMRLTPITLMSRALEKDLSELADKVLADHFPVNPTKYHKYAIRPKLRSHNYLHRDLVIQIVGDMTGPGHKVDLEQYDKCILVELYKHVAGISVVDESYRLCKGYNLDAIFSPAPDVPMVDAAAV